MPNIKNPAIRERNAQLFFGCSESFALVLNGQFPLRTPKKPAMRYLNQRTRALLRGIGWEITFPEWLEIWSASGKWDQRGIGRGSYCMARHGDTGPYRVGNVSIQLVEDNSRDGIKIAHATISRNGSHTSHLGTGRGWTRIIGKKSDSFQVVVGRKYVGSFSTKEAAEAAYKAACLSYRECVSHSAI